MVTRSLLAHVNLSIGFVVFFVFLGFGSQHFRNQLPIIVLQFRCESQVFIDFMVECMLQVGGFVCGLLAPDPLPVIQRNVGPVLHEHVGLGCGRGFV